MQFMKANKILPRPPPTAAEIAELQQRQLAAPLPSATTIGWPPGGAAAPAPTPGVAAPGVTAPGAPVPGTVPPGYPPVYNNPPPSGM